MAHEEPNDNTTAPGRPLIPVGGVRMNSASQGMILFNLALSRACYPKTE